MPQVHPTAILDGPVDLAEDVVVGPHCVLTGDIVIGAGSRLIGHVYLTGPLRMGINNVVYPFACLGFAPQYAQYDPAKPGRGLVIGDDNTFREHVTIHRALDDDAPTTIGDRNFMMVISHLGHDCRVGNDCTICNDSALGGHARMDDGVIVGGGASIHQHCRLGRGSFVSGGMGTSLDLAPYFMLTGYNVAASVNLVGLRRSGAARDLIDDVRWAHKIICRDGRTRQGTIEALQERGDRPIIREYIEFVQSSTRGICTARAKASRGQA